MLSIVGMLFQMKIHPTLKPQMTQMSLPAHIIPRICGIVVCSIFLCLKSGTLPGISL